MAQKSGDTESSAKAPGADPFAPMRDAGLENLLGMSTAWMEAMGEVGAEFAHFMTDRIQQDIKTQHAMMNCKSIEEFQRLQMEFLRKAMAEYQAETGKLLEMSMKAFMPAADRKG
jgi:hypothetical protein